MAIQKLDEKWFSQDKGELRRLLLYPHSNPLQVKKVYRAFDQEEGIEVAWNQVKLGKVSDESGNLRRVYSEVRLLKKFHNDHIISLYDVRKDEKQNTLNFIKEKNIYSVRSFGPRKNQNETEPNFENRFGFFSVR
ncbi:hypothetical protein QQ045_002742 [Rhodiola kirilowii]